MKHNNHTVLALKYRPQTFKELIGQDIMVQTIINSIKINENILRSETAAISAISIVNYFVNL